jgi:hypothetical protein
MVKEKTKNMICKLYAKSTHVKCQVYGCVMKKPVQHVRMQILK